MKSFRSLSFKFESKSVSRSEDFEVSNLTRERLSLTLSGLTSNGKRQR